MAYFNILSYVFSRAAYLITHVVALLWLNLLLNDPFNLGLPTLDFPRSEIRPAGQCNSFIVPNVVHDLKWFALWWGSHSILARDVYKKALGILDHPIERPLFAIIASFMWFANVWNWKPISDCARWEPLQTSLPVAIVSGVVVALAVALILTFLSLLPDHVFGTAKYAYPQGKFPHSGIMRTYPYGLVRHPAATGFLWAYWALPAYTANHIFLASIWTVFIVIGTLVFEEGGLKSCLGQPYLDYRNEVSAFYPNLGSLKQFLFGSSDSKAANGGSKSPATRARKVK